MGLLCKLIGSVCVMGAAGYFALSLNQVIEERKRELRRIYSILVQLKSEIQYMCTPLPDSFEKLAVTEKEPFGEWLLLVAEELKNQTVTSFTEAWMSGTEWLVHNSALNNEDIESLRELSDKLGNEDVNTQLKAIDYVLLHIEGNRTRLENEIQQKKKVTVTLSLFGGAMTLLLLL